MVISSQPVYLLVSQSCGFHEIFILISYLCWLQHVFRHSFNAYGYRKIYKYNCDSILRQILIRYFENVVNNDFRSLGFGTTSI